MRLSFWPLESRPHRVRLWLIRLIPLQVHVASIGFWSLGSAASRFFADLAAHSSRTRCDSHYWSPVHGGDCVPDANGIEKDIYLWLKQKNQRTKVRRKL